MGERRTKARLASPSRSRSASFTSQRRRFLHAPPTLSACSSSATRSRSAGGWPSGKSASPTSSKKDSTPSFGAGAARASRLQRIRGWNQSPPVARYLKTLLPVFEPDAVVAVFFLRSGTTLATSLAANRQHIEPIRARYAAKPFYGTSRPCDLLLEPPGLAGLYGLLQTEDAGFLPRLTEAAADVADPTALPAGDRRLLRDGEHPIPPGDLSAPLRSRPLRVPGRRGGDRTLRGWPWNPGPLAHARLPRRTDHEFWVANNDQHPNAEGHQTAAETLLPYLRSSVLSLE